MRRSSVRAFALCVLMLTAAGPALAATLPGFPFFVWHNPGTGAGNIYVFTAAGALCGVATMGGVGPAGGTTLAWETARDIIVTAPPLNGGTWFTVVAQPPGPFCGVITISPLVSYWIM